MWATAREQGHPPASSTCLPSVAGQTRGQSLGVTGGAVTASLTSNWAPITRQCQEWQVRSQQISVGYRLSENIAMLLYIYVKYTLRIICYVFYIYATVVALMKVLPEYSVQLCCPHISTSRLASWKEFRRKLQGSFLPLHHSLSCEKREKRNPVHCRGHLKVDVVPV